MKLETILAIRPTPGAILIGPPGVGKTYFAQEAARSLGAPLVVHQMTPGAREEELILKLLPGEDGRVVAHEGAILEAARLSHKGRVVLLLDEWDKSRPSADAFLLDFLQEGRIRWGIKESARLENLVVFLTSNAERELSEPLLRRLPVLERKPHGPAEVGRMLEETHAGHPFLGPAIRLYEAGLLAWERGYSPRPVTIQEIRQLLDAVTVNPQADWEELLGIFVAKTPREREGLRTALEELKGRRYNPARRKAGYSFEALEEAPEQEEGEERVQAPRIPRPWSPKVKAEVTSSLEGAVGLVAGEGAEAVFSRFAREVIKDAKHPEELRVPEEAALVSWQGREVALIKHPLPIEALREEEIWQGEGEVLVRAEDLPWKEALGLLKTLRYLSPTEVVGRSVEGGFEARVVISGELADFEAILPVNTPHPRRRALEERVHKARYSNVVPADVGPEDYGYSRISLWNSPSGYYKLERVLEKPERSDRRGVKITLQLPTTGNGRLYPGIVFGSRVQVFGESLYETWGDLGEGYRLKSTTLWEEGDEGWKALERRARAYLLAEVRKLRKALMVRAARLKEEA